MVRNQLPAKVVNAFNGTVLKHVGFQGNEILYIIILLLYYYYTIVLLLLY